MFQKLKHIGPGAMVAAAFIGPGTVTTAAVAGSSYGYTLLWAVLFSVIATYVLQEMAVRLGVIAKTGVGEALRAKLHKPALKFMISALVVMAIFIGNSAYEAGNISGAVLGFNDVTDVFEDFPVNPLILFMGGIAFLVLYSGKYKLIERSLIAMVSIMGGVFLVAVIVVQPDIGKVIRGIFLPILPKHALLMVIGLIGTTVVPYNIFLHASSVKEKWTGGAKDLKASRWDALFSIILGGVITMAILTCSAVVFEENPMKISTTSDLAKGLVPLLGDGAIPFMALGFLCAGFSSSLTAPLAAAYATSETLGWDSDLKGKKFRIIWIVVLVMGIVFSSLGYRPTLVIIFAQVANGLLLPIIAIFLLWIMNDKKIMGTHINSVRINIIGILIILITLILGIKAILAATIW